MTHLRQYITDTNQGEFLLSFLNHMDDQVLNQRSRMNTTTELISKKFLEQDAHGR